MLLMQVLAGFLAAPFLFLSSQDPTTTSRASLRHAAEQSEAGMKAPFMPREVLLRQPTIGDVRLSPGGRLLAFLRHNGPQAEVLLQDVASGVTSRLVAETRGVEIAWSGDGRLLWIADEDGMAVLDSATGTAKRILEWDERRAQRFWRVDARAADYAIIQERPASDTAAPYRYLLVDAAGRTRPLHEGALPLLDVVLTADGQLAFAAAYDGPQYDKVIRQFTPDGVRELLRCTGIETCRIAGYSEALQTLWILSHHGEDKLALQRWQAHTGAWETVHKDPAGIADAEGLIWNSGREDWVAISYHSDRLHWYGNSARDTGVLAALERHLPDANLQLSSSAEGQVWLVRAEQANWPIDRHFLYEADADRLRPLFEDDDASVQAAAAEHLAVAHPVSWQASDGMALHGYVYLPRGVPLSDVPLIAWLHGGPISRNYDEYHPAIQLLVNRGYAVFLPNFRASSGYGLRYTRAAQGDVGNGRVLSDVLDGLDYLLAEGIGDPDRQAVMGHSFGGYASLLAVSHHPERFRFAFAAAPPTEYGWIKQWQAEHETGSPRDAGPPVAISLRQHGFPFDDATWRQKMQQESPLAAIENLRVPIYIWAGAKDDRVPIKSIVHYVGEAKRHDKEVSLLIDPDAGHTPTTSLGTDVWMFLIERAAHRSFVGGVSPPTPELEAYLRTHLRIEGRSP